MELREVLEQLKNGEIDIEETEKYLRKQHRSTGWIGGTKTWNKSVQVLVHRKNLCD